MINKFIRNFVAKQIAGRSDDGIMITLKDPQKVTLAENIMADLLIRNGIDPRIIGSEQELKFILQQIENARIRNIQNTGIRNTESAKVFNIEGQSLDPNKPIVGGTQEGKELSKELSDRLSGKNTELIKQRIADKKIDDDLPPPGSRGGEDDIAAPVMNVEDAPEGFIDFVRTKDPEAAAKLQKVEDDIKAKIEAGNKRYLDKIKKQKEEGTYKRYNPEEGSQLDLEIKEEYQKAIRGESKLIKGKFKGTEEDFRDMIDEMTDDFANGGRVGFFMGSKFPKGLATMREMLKFFGKGKEKERTGSEILRLVNPKQFNKLLEDPNIYRKFDVQKGIGAPELIKNMQADLSKNRTMMVEEILNAAKNIRKSDINTIERKKEMIEEMVKRGIDRETAEEMANSLSTMAEAAAGMRSAPKLTDEGILELENILKNMETGGKDKRSLNADGGRIGLKDGMNRRTFLKLLGGLASIPIIGKIIKPLKTVKGVKNVPIIKTDNVPGKPEWFDQLVNKVIIEGDDVTKRFATGERQSIHQKTLDDGSVVRVTEDVDNGAVRVEYESEQNVFGDTVQMQYKKDLPGEGDPSPKAEFTTAESGPVGRRYGPDDYEIEVDEVGGTSISDLDSDVSKLKEYATGKGPTMKEIVQNKKRKDKAKRITEDPEAQSDAVVARQGEVSGEDYMYASGGIARMLGE